MKREFLQELTVDGRPLSKDVIDAIMAENGKDIQAAKTANDAEGLRSQLQQWQEKFTKAQEEHAQQLENLAFQNTVADAIRTARGRSVKAITALLDLDTIRTAQDKQAALSQALEALKGEAGYLFSEQTPPPYAVGTGTYNHQNQAPDTLAGALREKFERK
jgi:hypothetical protein